VSPEGGGGGGGEGQKRKRADRRCRRSNLVYVIVGSPVRGLVGLGRGRGVVLQKAVDQAFHRGAYLL